MTFHQRQLFLLHWLLVAENRKDRLVPIEHDPPYRGYGGGNFGREEAAAEGE